MTPERRKALSEGAKRSWLDPEKRAKRQAGMLRSWDDPLDYAIRSDIFVKATAKTKRNPRKDG